MPLPVVCLAGTATIANRMRYRLSGCNGHYASDYAVLCGMATTVEKHQIRLPGTNGELLFNDNGILGATAIAWDGNSITIPSISATHPNVIGTVVPPLGSANGVGLYVGALDVLGNGVSLRGDIGYSASGGAVSGRGISGQVSFTGSANWTVAGTIGPSAVQGKAQAATTGTIAKLSGVNGDVSTNTGAGVVTDAQSFIASVLALAAGTTITNYYGYRVQAPAAGGSITTAYGLKVDGIAHVGIGTAWGVYVDSDPSYFGGTVTVGDYTTTASLRINQLGDVGTGPLLTTGGTNAASIVGIAPTGTGFSSSMEVFSAADPLNSKFLRIRAGGALIGDDEASLLVGRRGTATAPALLRIGSGSTDSGGVLASIAFQFNAVTRASISSAGVLTGIATNLTGLPGSTGLVANSVASGQLDKTVLQYASFTYTLAQLLATNTVPRTLVAAQGAGTLIEVVSLTLELVFGSANFAGGGACAAYLGTDATGVLASAAMAATVFTTFAASQLIRVAGAQAVATSAATLNKALVFANPTADFTSGTGGSGIVKLVYRVHSGL